MHTIKDLQYYCMTPYDASFQGVHILFPKENVMNTLGEYLGAQGKKQLHTAETEKYAHVTFFFNGGRETPYEGEDRILVPSPKVATYDLKPEMSAYEVKDKFLKSSSAFAPSSPSRRTDTCPFSSPSVSHATMTFR